LENIPELQEEYDQGVDRMMERLERKGLKPICVIAFGSLAKDKEVRTNPDNSEIVDSDADLIILVEDRLGFSLQKLQSLLQGNIGQNGEIRYRKQADENTHEEPFSPHIPHFDVFLMTKKQYIEETTKRIKLTLEEEFNDRDWVNLVESMREVNNHLSTVVGAPPIHTDKYPVPPEIAKVRDAAKEALDLAKTRYKQALSRIPQEELPDWVK
jgi:predicted nucleotidyltransferase